MSHRHEPVLDDSPLAPRAQHGWKRRVTGWLIALLCAYLGLAYFLLPLYWSSFARRHPGLINLPNVTHAKTGLPGDPLNVGLVGAEEDLIRGLRASGWFPADPVTFKSSLRIVADTLDRRPYVEAPVSPLYLWGRIQDLAFEKPIGHNPSKRHHVRFWRSAQTDEQGQPLWVGAATLDTRVGLSHETEQITHHIGPDVDAERDKILAELKGAGWLVNAEWIDDFHALHDGKNGGGDPYTTDGRLGMGWLRVPENGAGGR